VERALEGRGGWALDLGCGHGFHYDFMSAARMESTVAMDIGLTALRNVKRRFPSAITVQSDIYQHPFKPGLFSSIYSIYNLEHLYYLEDALEQVAGLMAVDGAFLVSIPCEGGFLWNFGRKLTSERTMSKKLGADYRRIIAIEHCNTARRVITELKKRFEISGGSYFPLLIPSLNMNLTASFSFARKE
jgi:SAM-dependent methyltransferase